MGLQQVPRYPVADYAKSTSMIANHSTLKNALTTATIKTSSVSMMV
jgi:hypothetical protein